MAIALFASKVFSVSSNKIYTFSDFSRSGALNIEEQELDGQKPSTYIKGSKLEDVGFIVPLIAHDGINIENEIDDWMSIKDAAVPYLLLLNNRPLSSNKFLLINVSVQDATLDNNGKYLRAKIQLQFKEFVRYGSKKDSAGTTAESKSAKKRTNTNASVSKAQGAQMDTLENELYGG